MKRFCLLLVFIWIFCLAGCCYEPGTEGLYGMDSWYDRVPTFPADEFGYGTPDASVSSDETTPVDGVGTAIPDPVVDLDAMPQRKDDDFVKVTDYIPDLVVELRYASTNNFTGKRVYSFSDVYLRYGTVLKLMEVQKSLRQQGMLLKIWDGFRPTDAQYTLWNFRPDPMYVANPQNGFSSHSRGNTVDVTLVDANGQELEMPSDFDSFSALADRDYSDCTQAAAANAQLLQNLMQAQGFTGYDAEWWHFTDEHGYPVEEMFDPSVISLWYAECNQYINLRVAPDVTSEAIDQIPKNHTCTLLGWYDEHFAYVEFNGIRGYVNADYIRPL